MTRKGDSNWDIGQRICKWFQTLERLIGVQEHGWMNEWYKIFVQQRRIQSRHQCTSWQPDMIKQPSKQARRKQSSNTFFPLSARPSNTYLICSNAAIATSPGSSEPLRRRAIEICYQDGLQVTTWIPNTLLKQWPPFPPTRFERDRVFKVQEWKRRWYCERIGLVTLDRSTFTQRSSWFTPSKDWHLYVVLGSSSLW